MDLYNIPGDDHKHWRSQKFIQYVMGSTTGADTWLLRVLAEEHHLSLDERIWLCWLHTCCNCEVSAWMMFKDLDYKTISLKEVKHYWEVNRNKLVFVTDRVYVKSNNEFCNLISQFMKSTKRHPKRLLSMFDSFTELYNYLCSWRYMGRYSTELFLESLITVAKVSNLKPDSMKFDFNLGRTMTSGLLNTLYFDDLAMEFDSGLKLSESQCEFLDTELHNLYEELKVKSGLNITLSQMTPKLCSWRRLFKNQRYGTYYIDRQLHCLTLMKSHYPDREAVWDEIYAARKALFHESVLGENFGRDGIQKGRFFCWLQEGLTGFEGVDKPLWNTK